MQRGSYPLVFILMLSLSFIGCKKEKNYSTISQDSMLNLHVKQQPGDNMDPFSLTEIDFVGFPGAIGYSDNMPSLPFLIIGKNLHKKQKYVGHFIGTVSLHFDGKTRYLGIAMPVNDKYKTVDVESYNDFSAQHADVKLWLTDWLNFAYREKGLNSLTWNNEIDILRKFVQEND